jgi:predicted RNase H-like nuclease (RuvC/YqgF family)
MKTIVLEARERLLESLQADLQTTGERAMQLLREVEELRPMAGQLAEARADQADARQSVQMATIVFEARERLMETLQADLEASSNEMSQLRAEVDQLRPLTEQLVEARAGQASAEQDAKMKEIVLEARERLLESLQSELQNTGEEAARLRSEVLGLRPVQAQVRAGRTRGGWGHCV